MYLQRTTTTTTSKLECYKSFISPLIFSLQKILTTTKATKESDRHILSVNCKDTHGNESIMHTSASQMPPRASFKGEIGSVFGGTADLKSSSTIVSESSLLDAKDFEANFRGGGYEHPYPRPTILSNSITYDHIVCIDSDNVCFFH